MEAPFDVSTGTSSHDVFMAAVKGAIEAFFGAGYLLEGQQDIRQ